MQRSDALKKESVKRTNPPFENTNPTTLGRKETIEDYTQGSLSLLVQSSKKTPFPHQQGPSCHRGNITEESRANDFPLR